MRMVLEKRDVAGMSVICILALILVASGYRATTTAFHDQLVRDAEHTARGWAEYLAGNLDEIDQIVSGRPPSADSRRFMEQARHVGDVFRFKLFDRDGGLRFVSDEPLPAGTTIANHNPKAARVLASGLPFTEVEEGSKPGRPALYAETYIPVVQNGETVAIAEVYIDETAKRQIFSETFLTAIVITALLIAMGFGVPAIAFYLRTRQKERAEAEIIETNRRLRAIADNVSQGFCLFGPDRRLIFANDQYIAMYNLPPEMITPGTSLVEILEWRIASGIYAGGDSRAYIEERIASVSRTDRHRVIHELTDGRVLAVTHNPLPDGGWVATHDDITELRRIEEQITHLAHHDAVTDLPNRTSFRMRILDALATADERRSFAVLCLDLDHFKTVNDTLGHPLGDLLLKAVADRLSNTVGRADTVARLGGDEFAIIQSPVDRPEQSTALASHICEIMREPFDLDGHQVVTGTSIGIAIAPADGSSADELIKNADMALYRAKEEGRGAFRFFEAAMDTRMKQRRQMELDLRTALQDNQFELFYQPLIDARSDRVVGFEALLRWNHPERGQVSPNDFIPLCEDIGLIVPLGEWVIRQACAEAAGWPADVKVAVNVSAAQFRSGKLVPTVVSALSTSGIDPRRLEIEITESILLQNSEATLKTLHMLRNLGVRIAMDDFGTGYSSLNYLRSFPFDKLKLDGSFVKDLCDDEDAQAIIRAVAGLGNSLGMTTTAEGVETEEQLRRVQDDGYAEIQGFLYSPPRPASEIVEMFFPQRKAAGDVA